MVNNFTGDYFQNLEILIEFCVLLSIFTANLGFLLNLVTF